jgi:hypothetical protein
MKRSLERAHAMFQVHHEELLLDHGRSIVKCQEVRERRSEQGSENSKEESAFHKAPRGLGENQLFRLRSPRERGGILP